MGFDVGISLQKSMKYLPTQLLMTAHIYMLLGF